MSATLLSDVSNQVQKFWAPTFMPQLKEQVLLPNLMNKDYEGEIKRGGDTVYVSQINRPSAQRKTVGSGAESFSSQQLSTSRISVVANQRITASYELEDLTDLQSQLTKENSAIKQALLDSIEIELNNYCYSLVAPSTSSPDHSIASVTDFNLAQVVAMRNLAAQAKWKKDNWWLLVDPIFMGDLLDDTTLTSGDYAPDSPMVGGQFALKRFGFNILEDNSAGILTLSSTGQDVALGFHSDFAHLVMQRQPTIQVSSLHPNKQHGYLISVDILVGGALGVDGASKHIVAYNS